MRDADCVAFLQWALPRLALRWQGFRRVRRQVCRRLRGRLAALQLADLSAYRVLLSADRAHPEWRQLDALCRITISRFYRDRQVFQRLEQTGLPGLQTRAAARGAVRLRAWSAGCASGEEAYTLVLLTAFSPALAAGGWEIVATDSDRGMLARARRACYPPSSLRDLPARWHAAFESRGDQRCLAARYRSAVRFIEQDIRTESPQGPFDLILCRNLVFTYFAPDLQRAVAHRLADLLVPGGLLLIGIHETLPGPPAAFEAQCHWLYRRRPGPGPTHAG